MINIRESTFEEVAPYWREKLWDNRYDFKPVSCMKFLGGYDGDIPNKYTPRFFVAEINGEVAGVISSHATAETHYRVRGLYVNEEFRSRGVSVELVKKLIDVAKEGTYELLWVAPRQSSVNTYFKLGFKQFSGFTNEGFLYGPNCYMALDLRSLEH